MNAIFEKSVPAIYSVFYRLLLLFIYYVVNICCVYGEDNCKVKSKTTINTINIGLVGENGICLKDYAAQYKIDYDDREILDEAEYTITFSDGSPSQTYSVKQLKQNGGVIDHKFTKSSCGAKGMNGEVDDMFYVKVDVTTCNPKVYANGSLSNVRVLKGPEAHFECDSKKCVGDEFSFTNKSVDGQTYECEETFYSFWDFGDGKTSSERNPKKIYDKPGKYRVLLVVNSLEEDGEPAPLCNYDSTFKDIEVIDLPKLNAVQNIKVCAGDDIRSITLNGSTLDKIRYSGGSEIGLKDVSNKKTDSNTKATIPGFKAINNGFEIIEKTIEVIPYNELGCQGEPTKFKITVYPKPYLNKMSDVTACGGVYVNLSQPSSPVLGTTYTWNVVEGGENIGMTKLQGTGSYIDGFVAKQNNSVQNAKIEVVSSNQDPGMAACGSDTKSFTVTVTPTPKFSLDTTHITKCGVSDASITLKGLMPNHSYNVTFQGKKTLKTSDKDGKIKYDNLSKGVYKDIIVADAGNSSCSETNHDYLNFDEPAAPQMPDLSSNNKVYCEGESMTLSAAVETNIEQYSWTTPNGPKQGGATLTINPLTGANSGKYSLTVIRNKCSSTSNPIDVKVKVMPKVGFVNLPTKGLCGHFDFNTNDYLSITGDASYMKDIQWSVTPNTGVSYPTGSNSLNTKISFSQPGTYNIKLSYNTDCESNKEVLAQLVINPLPIVTLSSDKDTVCNGERVVLTASGADRYSWSVGSNTSNTISDVPTKKKEYIVSGTNTTTGCKSNPVSKTIDVSSKFDINISGPTSICEGQNFNELTASGANHYAWYNGGNPAADDAPISSTNKFTPETKEATYTVVGKKDNNVCVASKSVTTKIEKYLTFKAPNDTYFCEGGNVTVIASGANKYAWDGGTPTTTGEKVISTAGKHTVVGISASNCKSLPVEFMVEEKSKPTVSISSDANFICYGKDLILTAVGSGGTTPYSYKWDSETTYSSKSFISLKGEDTNKASITHTVSVKDKFGCISKTNAVKNISVDNPSVTILGGSEFCNGNSLELTASGDGVQYYWNGSSESSSKYSAQKTETVSLRGVDANGCESTASKRVTMRAVPKLSGEKEKEFCENTSVTLSVTLDKTASGYSWESGAKTSSKTFNATQSKTYSVVGYDDLNCPSAPFEIKVTEIKRPIVTISGSETVCQFGDPIPLTANITGGYDAIEWSTGAKTANISVKEAKTYNVTAYLKNCASNVATHPVTLIKNAKVWIDGEKQFCKDSTIILTGRAENGKTVEFYWNKSTTASNTISVNTVGSYILRAEDQYGCVSKDTLKVTQRAVPQLTGSDLVYFCDGGYTKLTVNKVDTALSKYKWDSEETTTQNTHLANEERVYKVVGYDSHNCPTEPFEINVKKTLLPEVSIEGGNTICLHGDPIELTAVFDKEDGKQYDIKWSTGKTTESITVLEGEAKKYTVDVTVKEGGCKLEQASHVVSLIENAKIKIDGDNQFCTDSTIILKGVVNSNNPVKFYWNESETPSETISVSEEGEYKLKAEDNYGCVSNVSKYVYQRAIPVLSGESVMYYCAGESTTLKVAMDSVASGYVWDSNPIGTDNTHVADETRTYSVVGYDKKNCPSNRFYIDVRETGIPAVSITGDTTVCKYGDSIVLTANLANVNDNNEIKWSTGETTQSITILPGTGGTYTVSVTATEGECSSPIASHKVALIENAKISIDGPAQFCTDSTIYLVGKVTSGNDVDFYWNESTTASDSLLVTEGGEYKVMAEDKYGCKTSDSRKINKRAVPVLTGLDTTFYCQYSSNDLVVTMDSVAKGYVWNEDPIGNKNTYFVDSEQIVNVVGYDLWNCPTKPKEMVVKETMLPVIKIEGDTTVCLYGDSVKLTVNVIEGKYDDIIWNNGKKGESINVKDGEYIAYATISVCESFKDTHNVELITNAEIKIKGVDEICTDSTAVLTAESVENLSYVWNGHDTNKDTIVVGRTGVYKVEGTDKYGCKSSAKKTVTQRDIPQLTIPPTAAYCQYDSIKLVATLNREASSYVWDGVNLKLQNYKYANEVRDYSVMAYDNLKCPSNTATVAVTETKIPVVTIKGPAHVCQNADPIVLTATVEGTHDRYEWNTNETTPSISVQYGGQFIAKAYIGVCVSAPDTFNVEFKQIPSLRIQEGASATYCDLWGIKLHAISPTAIKYRWEPEGVDTDENHVYTEGKHIVYVEDEFGCINKDSVVTSVKYGPDIAIHGDTTLCEFSITEIRLDCPECVSQTWSTGETDESIFIYEPGDYMVEGIGPNGCPNRAYHHLDVTQAPELEIIGETEILSNDSTTLTAIASGSEPFRYYWTPIHHMGSSIVVHSEDIDQWQTFTAMVYDKNNCYNFQSILVTKHSVKLNGKKEFCEGDSTTLTAVGNGIVGLKWSTGDTASSITLKDAGLYSVISTHDNGMVDTLNFEIVVRPNPVLAITGDLSICRGDSSFLIAEGDAKEYYWNTGVNLDTIVVREANEYSVSAISKYGCVSYDTVNTIVYDLPDVSIVGPDTVLEESSIFLNALGAITYHWETPDTISEKIEVFEGGTYRVTGVDEHNCKNSATHDVRTIPIPHPLINDTTNGYAIACIDDKVTLIASGAETYLWDTGETNDTIYVTESRVYTVKGCLSNGQCRENSYSVEFSPHPRMMKVEGETKICADSFSVFTAYTYNDTLISHFVWSTGEETQSVMVRDSQLYRVSAVSKYGCLSDTLSVTLAYHPTPEPLITGIPEVCTGSSTTLYANGGTKYLWLDSGEDTESINVAAPGKRTLRVWNEFGCAADTSIFVDDRGVPVVDITGKVEICDGDSAILSADGIQFLENHYLWNTGDTTKSIVVDKSGDYSVALTNRSGCVTTDTLHFVVHPNPVIGIDGVDYVCTRDSIALKCSQISGNKIVKYNWSTGETDSVEYVTKTGVYILQVIDEFTCYSNVASHEIKSEIPSPEPWITGIPEVCEGSETQLHANGGARYLWMVSGEETDYINVSKPGKQVLRAWSEFGCKADTSIYVEDRGVPVIVVVGKDGVCDGDSATLSAEGIQFMENHYLWNTGDTTPSIVVNAPGDYSVTLTNRSGCVAVDTLHFEVYSNPVVDIDGVDYVCTNDSIALKYSQISGNKIVKYNWSTGETDSVEYVTKTGVYTLQVIDEHSCYSNVASHEIKSEIPSPEPWITGIPEVCEGSSTRLRANGGVRYLWLDSGDETEYSDITKPGMHVVRAWSEYGCKADTSIFVENRGKALVKVAGKEGVCEGDSTTLSAEGILFMENYYLWNTGDTTRSIVVDKPGDYSVVLTNRSGCVATDTLHFEVYPNPVIEIDGGDYVCVDDSMALKVKQISGNKIVKYSWNTGETNAVEFVTSAGTYTLQVVDDHTCYSNIASHEVQMRVPNPVSVTGDFDICVEQEDVATVVAYSEGAAFYSWLQKSDTLVYGNPELSARYNGNYRVVTTDSFGCRSYKDIEIKGHKAPHVRIYGAEIPVCGPDTAKLSSASEQIVVAYEWNTGDTTSYIMTDHSGDFWLIGTDIYGCHATDSVQLILNDIPGMHLDGELGYCPNESTDINVVGAEYYLWSNGSNNNHAVIHEAGDYSVYGRDKYGCEKTIDFHVVEYYVPDVKLEEHPNIINRKDPTISFSASTTDDISNSSFVWNMGDGGVVEDKAFDYTFDLSELRMFKVVMTVQTIDGCAYNRTVMLPVDLDIPNTITPNGDGLNDAFMEGFELEIFDRHGKRVFYGNNGWDGYLEDGRIVADTYYYVLIDVTGEIYRGYVTVRK